MPPQRVEEATVPALALAAEDSEQLWGFGPGYRVRDVDHLVWSLRLVSTATKPEHQFYILADGVVSVALDGNDGLAPEEAKGARDDQIPTEQIPAQAPAEEPP